MEDILWHPDHWSPCHVFKIETQTFPLTYKFGLNRVFPSNVRNLTFGGACG